MYGSQNITFKEICICTAEWGLMNGRACLNESLFTPRAVCHNNDSLIVYLNKFPPVRGGCTGVQK